jgi:hypothetical protein
LVTLVVPVMSCGGEENQCVGGVLLEFVVYGGGVLIWGLC